ncbi:MAG: hypothetical protein M1813_002347 [Trichoglossum hirsutum]|nr:MAG: hypothetical protein M1813_002347 [Trichoglossum hirsutum]
MDRPWNPADWRPTVYGYKLNPPSAEYIQQSGDEIRLCTGRIIDTPYDPENWYFRAVRLLDLGYPELAVGDVYKATLLVDAGLDYYSSLGERVRLHFGMSLWCQDNHKVSDANSFDPILMHRLLRTVRRSSYRIMVSALALIRAYTDSKAVCQMALRKYHMDGFLVRSLGTAIDWLKERETRLNATERQKEYELRNGHVLMRPYPWIPAEYLQRDQTLVDDLNGELRTYGPSCEIQPSSVKRSPRSEVGGVKTAPDNLGVFATKTIPLYGRVFLDITPIGANLTSTYNVCANCCGSLPLTPLTLQCCSTAVFCSPKCRELALAHYHSPLCGKDFSWIYAGTKSTITHVPDKRPAIFLRVLAMCVHQDAHPLQLPAIARLMPSYESDHPSGWIMQGNVIMPIKILQALGVEVFADLRYDTWVIQTLWWRCKNNLSANLETDTPIAALNPYSSFVNHSCEPNVFWLSTQSSTLELRALRRIKKGEELYISYLTSGMPKKERRIWLNQWLGRDCACPKCEREP